MRVLHVAEAFPPESSGGTQDHVHEIAAEQARRGHHVRVLSGSSETRNPGLAETSGLDGLQVTRVHREDDPDRWDAELPPHVEESLESVLHDFHPDLVHVHHWRRLGRTVIRTADRLGIPAIATLHDFGVTCPRVDRWRPSGEVCERPLGPTACTPCVPRFDDLDDSRLDREIERYRDEMRIELQLARRVLTPTSFVAELVAQTLGIPAERFEVERPSYAPRFSTPPTPAARGEGPLRVGNWGTLSRRTGTDLLLEATRQISKSRDGPGVEIHLFGHGRDEKTDRRLSELARGLPVQFHGAFDLESLAATGLHLAVIASPALVLHSTTVNEAAELGLPVLAPAAGAFVEQVGARGLLFERGSSSDLAAKMRRLRDDEAFRDRLAGSSHAPAPTPQAMVDRLDELYIQICGSDEFRGANA